MPRQEVRRRKQRTVNFQANSKVSEPLSRGMVYREIFLRLQGQPTLTALNNTAAKTQRGDEWGVIKEINLVANHTDVIRTIDGNALWWLNWFLYRKAPKVEVTLGDGATANPSFDSTLILPLWFPQSFKPIDTALDSRQLSDLKVEILWGDFDDINSDATAWTVEPTIEVHSLEAFNVTGPFSQWRIFPDEREIVASNPRFQILLPVGPMYRGFMMNFTDAGVDAGDILNNLKVKAGSTIYADLPREVLKQVHEERVALPRSFSGTAYDDLRIGNDNSLDGWYFYDHVTDGRLSESIDTLGFSEFELELDVTIGAGTTKVIVYPMEIVPVRGQQRNGARANG